MIDFAKITKTLGGLDCHYFGVRESFGTKLHCFGVWTRYGVCESAYDEQGRHLVWKPNETRWVLCETDDFAIIAPPKIVEVTRWIGLRCDSKGEYTIESVSKKERLGHPIFLAKQQHTFRFEVPNE